MTTRPPLPPELNFKLADRLRELRIEANMLQHELAPALNCDAAAISRWERGFRVPTLETLHRYSQVFNISVADLLKDVL